MAQFEKYVRRGSEHGRASQIDFRKWAQHAFSTVGVAIVLGTVGIANVCVGFGGGTPDTLPELNLPSSTRHLESYNSCANKSACVVLYLNPEKISEAEQVKELSGIFTSLLGSTAGFRLVLGGGTEADSRAFARSWELGSYFDTQGSFAASAGIVEEVEWIVAGPDGRIVARHQGLPQDEASEQELLAFIAGPLGLGSFIPEEYRES